MYETQSENKDVDSYLDCYSDTLDTLDIAQYDGNDSLAEDNPLTIPSNFSTLGVRTRVANFELNQAKQTASICQDALVQDFKITSKDQDGNINIECSSGFYAQIAKPTLCSLSQDHIPPVLNTSVFCENLTKNIDKHGYEFNRTIFFKLGEVRKVTVHVHHSSRLVQVQGGSLMPDKTTSASWFVKNILYGKFQTLARSKSYSISKFNDALTSQAVTSGKNNEDKCGSCEIAFDSRSKPLYCPKCVRWFHKTNCYRGHSCNGNSRNSPSSSAWLQSASPRPQSASGSRPAWPSLSLTATSFQSEQRPTTSSSVITQASSTFVTLSCPSGVICPVSSSTSRATSESPSLSLGTQEAASILDPDALTFMPQFLPPPATNRKKPKQKQNLPNFSPEKAEIESLKIELGFARTKVVDLETKDNDAENTIKIYSHKLKILEENRTNSLHEKYFSPSSQASKFSTETLSAPDCSCQIRAQISRNTLNLKELEMKLSSEMQLLNRKLDYIINQSITCSSTPETRTNSVPASSSSSIPSSPVSSSDPEIPGNIPTAASSPLNHPDHEDPVEAEPSSATDSDDNESDFNFSDVNFESFSRANLN